ncbi:MAG TPA: A/G-specific adenine glycosylase [Candidatus Borkfalkia excrementipullorum]|nr:A/G-specific adenine glycosylase [Candidatus Borkfalkia excrementipullorum]
MEQILTADGRAEALRQLPALLLPWYDTNKRDLPWRINTDPYRVWISEIMLQQTRVEAAKEHYIRFLRELPTAADLAACPEEKLLKLWEGLGYYSRARNLQRAAKIVAETGFPRTAAELKKLPGIGDYTAGAIASIAFGQPAPAVDGNVIRVLSRLLGDGRSPEMLKTAFAEELAPAYPAQRRGDFTQSLMELGATVCLPSSPLCLTCPLFALCKTKSDALPARKQKPERRREDKTLLLFRAGETVALCRRNDGVLKGMYGFFAVGASLSDAQIAAFLRGAGVQNFEIGEKRRHKHVFSHIEWTMLARVIELPDEKQLAAADETAGARAIGMPADTEISPFASLKYFTKAQIEADISLPSAFRWCMELL